ncbi:hypothetical protein FACS189493_2160 [Spirochaetia bacterium]|nr:hypothetical protein FACS189493_2160 [Spirochaetia bacterium]
MFLSLDSRTNYYGDYSGYGTKVTVKITIVPITDEELPNGTEYFVVSDYVKN